MGYRRCPQDSLDEDDVEAGVVDTDIFGDGLGAAAVEAASSGGCNEGVAMGVVSAETVEQPPPTMAAASGSADMPDVHPRLGGGAGKESSGSAAVVVYFPQGKVSYYSHDLRFEAVCRHHQTAGDDATLCRLTRTAKASRRKKAQGRPVGLLASWLEMASQHQSKADHCARFWVSACITREHRRAARARLMALPNGRDLAACERAQEPGEDSEPEGNP